MPTPGPGQSSLIAVAVTAVLVWLWAGNGGNVPADDEDAPDEGAADAPPESWSRSLRTTQYNREGDMEYILEASEQVQQSDDLIRITAPVLRLFDNSRMRWQVTSVSGTIEGGTEQDEDRRLDLSGDVRVDYTDDRGRSLVMTTDRMTVYPDDEVLYSNVAVHLTGTGFEQASTGMRAALQEGRLTFFGRVQGRFHDE